MKFFQIDLGDEFRALHESQREQLWSEWEAKQKTSFLSRRHDQAAVYLYYLVFPFGIFLLCMSHHHSSRLIPGFFCVLVPLLWFFLPAFVQVFQLRKFMKSRARELADQQDSG